MPTFVKGDMWSVFDKTDWFLITTNYTVKKNREAVMGAGIAKQARDRFPPIAMALGEKIERAEDLHLELPKVATIGFYGHSPTRVGYFMVKHHWAEAASLDLIESSVYALEDILESVKAYNYPYPLRVDLNFPGVGNGKLSREEVLPLLESLPSYVHIWEYE